MTVGVLRRGGAAFAATLLAAGVLSVAGPASATRASSPSAACPQGDGITVVVDFGSLGGGVQVRCVTEPVTSGFDALAKAGFAYDLTQRFQGLLCRIDGKPADDPCINAPPVNRYWAYWTAARPGGTWTYSDQGAGTRTPPPGSVEGWAFSDGCDRKPGAAPCPSATTTTRPAPTTTTRSGTGAGGGDSGLAPGGSDDPGSTGPDAPADPDDPSTTVNRESGADPSVSTSRTGDRAPRAGETGDDEQASTELDATAASNDAAGSPVGALVGAAAVLAIAGAGAVTARRRRAVDDGGA